MPPIKIREKRQHKKIIEVFKKVKKSYPQIKELCDKLIKREEKLLLEKEMNNYDIDM